MCELIVYMCLLISNLCICRWGKLYGFMSAFDACVIVHIEIQGTLKLLLFRK